MRLQRMDAAIREQSTEVDVLPFRERKVNLLTIDRLADANDVLIDDPSRPNVQMPDLGVSHLSRGKPDRDSRCVERRPRRLAIEAIEARRVRLRDGVVLALFATAESVDDDENEERARGHSPRKISDAYAPESRRQNAEERKVRRALSAFCILHSAFRERQLAERASSCRAENIRCVRA